MANNGINYNSKNFVQIRTELIDMVKDYYPDIFNDFNDASVGMMLLELNAAVGDILSFNSDRMFQETQIDNAQTKKAIMNLARNMGVKIPNKRPSVTIVDFSVTIPLLGDSFDISYAPIINSGTQVSGAGKIFETIYDIDFSNPFNYNGIPNRVILPNFNSNGTLINYTLTKREIVINGFTKYFKRIINNNDVVPFFEIILPENNVIGIDSVISLDGVNFNTIPSNFEFLKEENKWFEVDSLAENKVFVEDFNRTSDNSKLRAGKWLLVDKKFITEYTDLGFIKLIFGSGSKDMSSLSSFDINSPLVNQMVNLVNNLSLGQTPKSNTTIFVKYRVGGGSDSNLGPNTLTNLGVVNMVVNGVNESINLSVRNSLRVNNPLPALGGKDAPSIDEIRYMTKYNFSSQNRAVTLKDYKILISKMPSQFGVPFRVGVSEYQNKININILGLNELGKLSNNSTNVLRDNISNYLSDYRMINDYIKVTNGKIINISVEVDLMVNKNLSSNQIISQVVNEVSSYFDINKYDMGQDIFISPLIEKINNVGGVLNVIDIRFYNKVGEGKYSLNETSQRLLSQTTRQIDILDEYTLYGEENSMFEILLPNSDIKIRIK